MQKTFLWEDSCPKASTVKTFISFKYAAEEDRRSSRFVFPISIWICRRFKGTSEPLGSVLWQLKMSAAKRSCLGSWQVVTQMLISSWPCCAQGCTEVSDSPGELGCQLSPCISHGGLPMKCEPLWGIFGKEHLSQTLLAKDIQMFGPLLCVWHLFTLLPVVSSRHKSSRCRIKAKINPLVETGSCSSSVKKELPPAMEILPDFLLKPVCSA